MNFETATFLQRFKLKRFKNSIFASLQKLKLVLKLLKLEPPRKHIQVGQRWGTRWGTVWTRSCVFEVQKWTVAFQLFKTFYSSKSLLFTSFIFIYIMLFAFNPYFEETFQSFPIIANFLEIALTNDKIRKDSQKNVIHGFFS